MVEIEKKRFWELDFLRGLCVILMVIDHFFYSAMAILPAVWAWANYEFWTGLNDFAIMYWTDMAHSVAHFVVISIFFLICGISCTLSQSNLVRGLKTLGVAFAITLVTSFGESVFDMDITVRFGVIHMLAAAMLIYWVLSFLGSLIKKIPKSVAQWIGRLLPSAVGILAIIIFFNIPLGYFGVRHDTDGARYLYLFSSVSIDGSERWKNFVSIFVEVTNSSFYSSDYFPILPYVAIVLIGGLIGELFYHSRKKYALQRLDGKWNKPVVFVGRHALLVYILHQIVIVGVLFAIGGIYYLKAA